jgi:hypothetical protein
MRKPLALIVAFLLVAAPALALAAGTASAKDIVTIPLDKRIEVTPGIFAHLIQVTISDTTYGGSFAEDQSKVIFPILVYNYENRGTVAQNGHLHVRFVDDQGQSYDGSDAGTMDPVQPGKTSSTRIIEVNIPKDRRVTELTVLLGFDEQTFKLYYPDMPTPTATPGPAGTPSASPKGNVCLGGLLLPLLLVGAVWIGRRVTGK